MARLAAWILAAGVALHSGATAQSFSGPHGVPPTQQPKLTIHPDMFEEPRSTGAISFTSDAQPQPIPGKRGVVVGIEIAPGARLGVGVFGTRNQTPAIEQVGPMRQKTRKAGVGISLRF